MSVGRTLVVAGLALVAIGILVIVAERLPIHWGRLPGDIVWRWGNTTIYIPIGTLIIANGVLWLIWWLASRGRG
ncbi:MAG: DUF2905 domain-containing protein [Bryobacteraceae bacterium]|jgi:hypothetical protein|nr:DUF2905 domain-containing protein [Bryobacteraceae bacterium]